jgi:hypothetical protein
VSGDDFSDLAALWSAPAPPAERGELERLARQTPRRARLAQGAEFGFAALIALCIAGAMLWRLGPATLLIGSLILLLLGWSAWNRDRLARLAMLVDRSDRPSFVASLVHAKQAELRRSTIGLALIVPGAILATLLSYVLQMGAAPPTFADFVSTVVLTPRGLFAFLLLGGAVALLTLSHLRLIEELARLHALALDYAEEAQRED